MKQFFLDMKISHKLTISGLTLLMPLLVLLYMLVAEKNIAIEFSEKEVIGVTYLEPMRGLIEDVPQHRGMSYALLNGKTDFREKVSRKSAEIDANMQKIDALDQQYGPILNTNNEWQTIKRDWDALESENLNLSSDESFSRHTTFINRLILFMHHVADQSNLMLDPKLDSFYLIDSIFLKIPPITEQIGRLRGMGAGIMTRGQITPAESSNILLIEGGIEALVEELRIGMASSVSANSEHSRMQTITKDAITKLHHYEKILQNRIETGQAFDMDPQRYFDQGTEVLNSFFHLYDEASPVLVNILKDRVKKLKNSRTITLAEAMIFIVIGVLAGVFTIRSISRSLSEMTAAVEKVAHGDLSVEIESRGKDEVGTLGQSFLKMIAGLREAEVQKATAAKLSAMVENAVTNFMLADNDFNITYINPASLKTLQSVAHLLPCPVEELLGKSMDLFHKNPVAVRRLLSDPKNLPYSTTFTLGEEVISLTAVAIYDHNKERIGTMANWGLITQRARLSTSLKETTVSVASASEELATASREMQANAEHTTEQAQNVATISNQTDQNVQSVAAAAEEMSVTVKEISKNVHNANQITEQAVEMAESMNETITKLDASNSEIGNVVKVISMIAGQTNLLALNATIEAARAGDAGKGFAVVANEVKELAKGTSKATDEIRQQIVAIQSNTKGAIESIEKITEIIKENNSITTSIASAVEQQSMTTNEISLNMAEAAKETKQVVEELEEIIATSQNTASGAVNIGEASEELSRTASHLSSLTEE